MEDFRRRRQRAQDYTFHAPKVFEQAFHQDPQGVKNGGIIQLFDGL